MTVFFQKYMCQLQQHVSDEFQITPGLYTVLANSRKTLRRVTYNDFVKGKDYPLESVVC